MQLRHDVELLVGMVKGSYMEHVLDLLGGSPKEVHGIVCESLVQGADTLLGIIQALTDVLTEALTERCVEVSKSFHVK